MEELFAAVLGAVVGAGATLFVESRRQSSAEKKAEWNALDLLLLDLGRRRVFLVPGRTLVPGTDTSSGSDFDRMTHSVLAVRAQIAEVMRSLRPKSPARGPVRAMYRACNSFLESAERSPDRHWIAADDLRLALGEQAEIIAGSSKENVELVLPGSEAL
jgi:hypothetical protein